MCDEYEDERLRAYWRLLEEREKLASLEPGESEEPLVKPVATVPETHKPKARVALR